MRTAFCSSGWLVEYLETLEYTSVVFGEGVGGGVDRLCAPPPGNPINTDVNGQQYEVDSLLIHEACPLAIR